MKIMQNFRKYNKIGISDCIVLSKLSSTLFISVDKQNIRRVGPIRRNQQQSDAHSSQWYDWRQFVIILNKYTN